MILGGFIRSFLPPSPDAASLSFLPSSVGPSPFLSPFLSASPFEQRACASSNRASPWDSSDNPPIVPSTVPLLPSPNFIISISVRSVFGSGGVHDCSRVLDESSSTSMVTTVGSPYDEERFFSSGKTTNQSCSDDSIVVFFFLDLSLLRLSVFLDGEKLQ
uniref:(northern house mosquito) hypothetical protein n=1 Tax=Culex pipiens TaxID=7175 RepID=A0A8D8HL62_CULPI